MGHKPWDMPWRRAERRRGKQAWREEVSDETIVRSCMASFGHDLSQLTDEELRAGVDKLCRLVASSGVSAEEAGENLRRATDGGG